MQSSCNVSVGWLQTNEYARFTFYRQIVDYPQKNKQFRPLSDETQIRLQTHTIFLSALPGR